MINVSDQHRLQEAAGAKCGGPSAVRSAQTAAAGQPHGTGSAAQHVATGPATDFAAVPVGVAFAAAVLTGREASAMVSRGTERSSSRARIPCTTSREAASSQVGLPTASVHLYGG
jgi:hypothetical protein